MRTTKDFYNTWVKVLLIGTPIGLLLSWVGGESIIGWIGAFILIFSTLFSLGPTLIIEDYLNWKAKNKYRN